MRQPLVAPTSMYSMKRTMWPVPRKWRAIGDDRVLVDAALDHHVDLDRREARGGRGVDALEHLRHREVDVVHRAERRVVERVEAHGDALRGRRRAARAPCCASSEPLVVSVRSTSATSREHRDQPLEVLAQQRLAAGQPDLLDAEADEHARDARDLLERQQLVVRQERVVAAEHLLRHAVDAAEVAAVGDRDAQVVQAPAARVRERPARRRARGVAHERRARRSAARGRRSERSWSCLGRIGLR